MAYDLSTYEGRQAARDAGNWVGTDSSGNIVMEPSGGGGGGTSSGSTSGGSSGGTSGGTSSSGTYTTVNGQQTISSMGSQLRSVGWQGDPNDANAVIAAYAQTTGGAVTPSGGSTGGTGGTGGAPGNTTTYTNTDAANQAIAAANTAATIAYNNAKLNLDSEDLAFRKAQQAFAESLSRAQMTGTFEGQLTLPALMGWAQTFGTYGQPATGQQTLAAQQQAFNQAATAAGLTGVYTAPQATGSGNLALDAFTYKASPADQQTYLSANGGNRQAAAEQYLRDVTGAVQSAVQQAGGTFGPQSMQQWVYGASTPQTTLAAQGQYFNQALSQAQLNQKTTQDYLNLLASLRGPQDYGQYLRVMASAPQGLQSLVNAAAAGGGRVPAFGTTGASTTPATLGGLMGQAGSGGTAPGGTSYDEYMRAAQGLPAPSQISPQNWNAMTDIQRQLLLGMYEQTGWNVNDALAQYKASLPKFASNTPQVGTTKLV
jgi:hypothetical protein